MADVTLTVYKAARSAASGVDFTTNKTAATDANTYHVANDGKVFLMMNSTAGGTASVATPNTVDGLAIGELSLTVTAEKQLLWGPFPVAVYGADLQFTVSADTDVLAFGF